MRRRKLSPVDVQGYAAMLCYASAPSAPSLHERVARQLGWSVEDARSVSLASLRELVTDEALRRELAEAIAKGPSWRG